MMGKREAEQFEQALQQAARGQSVEGQTAPLVHTARQVMTLSETPPPAPHGLQPGRQRFLAQAARLRAERLPRRPAFAWATRLAPALAVFVIVFGIALASVRASSTSLPGEALYSVKLAAEGIQVALTSHAEKRVSLELTLAEERLDEIVELLERQRPIGAAVSSSAVQQMEQALEMATELQNSAASPALLRLAEAIQQHEQAIAGAAGKPSEVPVLELLRAMEKVREDAAFGATDPSALRQRVRLGTPAGPTAQPSMPRPSPRGPSTATPQSPSASVVPGSMQTPQRTGQPSGSPGPSGTPNHIPGSTLTSQPAGGPQESHTPEPGDLPGATRTPSRTPRSSVTPQPTGSPQASHTPGPSQTPDPTGTPGSTPGSSVTPQPTEGPQASRTPGPSESPDPTRTPSRTPSSNVTPQSTGNPHASRTPEPGGTAGPGGSCGKN